MIHPTSVPRPLRIGVAVVGVAGAIALAGCSPADSASTADTGTDDPTSSNGSSTDPGSSTDSDSSTDSGSSATSSYNDGTYTGEGSYATPESVETVTVTVTLESDVITDVEVTGNPTKRESEEYQGKFIGGIADVVVGEDIDTISVSRVAGSSLTSGGFNQAIEQIKAEAAA